MTAAAAAAGACEGTLACSTCHLIFAEKDYKQLPEKPTDEELDMLDLAYGLTDTLVSLSLSLTLSWPIRGWIRGII